MSRIKELADRVAVLGTFLDAAGKAHADDKRELAAEFKAEKKRTGTQQVAASLPGTGDIGKVSLVQPKASAVIADPQAFLKWVEEAAPSEIEVTVRVRPAFETAVLKEMTAAGVATWANKNTGLVHEQVPGVEMQGRAAYLRTTVPDKGAVLDALRAGALDTAALLPALAPAPADADGAA